jgi:DNA-binding protein HU-beta
MTKVELVAEMARASGLTKTQAERGLTGCLAAIRKALTRGKEVRLAGFGTFHVSRRIPRKYRNPRTGTLMAIPAMRLPRFRPSRALKRVISKTEV